ncbi:MAG: hypothetical protein AAGI07_15100, partial [Bacteroidota bacterium]
MTHTEKEEIIYHAFSRTFSIYEINWRALATYSEFKKLAKDTVIKAAFKVEKNIYYLIKGSTGNFSFKND